MFLLSDLKNCQFVKDHFHLKRKVWLEHIGETLYNQNWTHLEGVLNCKTKEDFEYHVSQINEGLKAYPQHVQYLKGYFDDPKSIAKYEIAKIRGGLVTITSAAAEQMHASNEVALPTKLMGIVSPEEQFYEFSRRGDEWVRRDLEAESKLELFQFRSMRTLHQDSIESKALFALYRYPYEEFFLKHSNVCPYIGKNLCTMIAVK